MRLKLACCRCVVWHRRSMNYKNLNYEIETDSQNGSRRAVRVGYEL